MSTSASEGTSAKIGVAAFTADLFAGRIGEVFRLVRSVDTPGAALTPYELELVEVKRWGKAVAGGTHEPFALLFMLRSRHPLGRGLYRVLHDALEADDLFLSRVVVPGKEPRAVYYEAVFA
jgi:hypothetical protein